MIVLCYPKCSTCQKAMKWLQEHGFSYTERDIVKDRLPTMSEEEQLQLLATNGMLVKRPLVVMENAVLTGFKEKEWEQEMQEPSDR